jgi:hypothetical protein
MCATTHLALAAREAVGNAVEVALDIDVIIDSDAAHSGALSVCD